MRRTRLLLTDLVDATEQATGIGASQQAWDLRSTSP
jgi:hypothetical protein